MKTLITTTLILAALSTSVQAAPFNFSTDLEWWAYSNSKATCTTGITPTSNQIFTPERFIVGDNIQTPTHKNNRISNVDWDKKSIDIRGFFANGKPMWVTLYARYTDCMKQESK